MFALIKCRYFKISSVLDVIAALALIVTIKYAKLSPSLKYSLCGIAMAQGSLASFFTVKNFFSNSSPYPNVFPETLASGVLDRDTRDAAAIASSFKQATASFKKAESGTNQN